MATRPKCISVYRLLAKQVASPFSEARKGWVEAHNGAHSFGRYQISLRASVYKSSSLAALKPISPVRVRWNRAAANANGVTLYWFSFNDFVTPLTVLYKSRAGWFVQGPLLDKLVWLQCSAAPCVRVSVSLSRSLALRCNVTHSAHSSVFLSLASVEGKTGWLTDGLADERWQSHSMETYIETAFCRPTAAPQLPYQRVTLAVWLPRGSKRASAGIVAEMLL